MFYFFLQQSPRNGEEELSDNEMPESDRNQSSQPGSQQPMTHSRTEEPGSESPRPRSASPRSPSPDQDRQLKVKVRPAFMVLFASLAVCSELISDGGIGIHRFRIEVLWRTIFWFGSFEVGGGPPNQIQFRFFQERTSDSNQKMTLQSINLHGTPQQTSQQ